MDAWSRFTDDVASIIDTGWHVDAKKLYVARATEALRRELSVEQQAEAARIARMCPRCGSRIDDQHSPPLPAPASTAY